jgi:hypothetical protein
MSDEPIRASVPITASPLSRDNELGLRPPRTPLGESLPGRVGLIRLNGTCLNSFSQWCGTHTYDFKSDVVLFMDADTVAYRLLAESVIEAATLDMHSA